jgi:dienelactone hydrolase
MTAMDRTRRGRGCWSLARRVLACALLMAVVPAPVAHAGETHRYSVGTESFEGYYARSPHSRGLVLLVHDWDGLTDYERRRAAMLVDEGYSVFAVDLYGAGIRPTSLEDKRRLSGALYADRERMRALLRGGLRAAADLGADTDDAVAIGYCFGGTAILELARAGEPLKGFASFHGGLATPEGQDYSAVKAPLRVYHGTADRAVSMNDFAALAAQLESAGVPHEMVTYSGAPHAFTVFGSDRYRRDADEKSWAAFLRFLDATWPAGM